MEAARTPGILQLFQLEEGQAFQDMTDHGLALQAPLSLRAADLPPPPWHAPCTSMHHVHPCTTSLAAWSLKIRSIRPDWIAA